jgi:hypothetical protein
MLSLSQGGAALALGYSDSTPTALKYRYPQPLRNTFKNAIN